jgi:hypothetical protein
VKAEALRFLPAAAWMAAIFALSRRTELPTLGLGPAPVSTAGHVAFYGVLAVLLWWGMPPRRLSPRARLAAAFGAAVLFGGFVPGREVSVVDLAVDALGAAIGLAAVARGTRRGAGGGRVAPVAAPDAPGAPAPAEAAPEAHRPWWRRLFGG